MLFQEAQSTKYAVNVFEGDENERAFSRCETNRKTKISKSLSGLLVCPLIMSLAERLPSKF